MVGTTAPQEGIPEEGAAAVEFGHKSIITLVSGIINTTTRCVGPHRRTPAGLTISSNIDVPAAVYHDSITVIIAVANGRAAQESIPGEGTAAVYPGSKGIPTPCLHIRSGGIGPHRRAPGGIGAIVVIHCPFCSCTSRDIDVPAAVVYGDSRTET